MYILLIVWFWMTVFRDDTCKLTLKISNWNKRRYTSVCGFIKYVVRCIDRNNYRVQIYWRRLKYMHASLDPMREQVQYSCNTLTCVVSNDFMVKFGALERPTTPIKYKICFITKCKAKSRREFIFGFTAKNKSRPACWSSPARQTANRQCMYM